MFSVDESQFITPYNTEEFWKITNAAMRHMDKVGTLTEVIAIDLRKLLANPEGTKVSFLRADLKLNAQRVARHEAHAAKLTFAAGKAHKKAWMTYLQLFTEPAKQKRGRTFVVN